MRDLLSGQVVAKRKSKMSTFEEWVSGFEKMKELDVGETVEELNAKIIQGLSTKPVGNPEKCMMCEVTRDSLPHWRKI